MPELPQKETTKQVTRRQAPSDESETEDLKFRTRVKGHRFVLGSHVNCTTML